MLGSAKKGEGESKSSWKVLIMDKVTVKVMSHSCKMADITDQAVSLVEDLFRRREPMPCTDAVYFMQPTKENIVMLLSDMSGRMPLYRSAYVFFSSPIPKELINHIKNDTSVLPRISALREAYITDHEKALEELFGEHIATNSRRFEACVNTIATRVATVFASLKELPRVRYRAAKITDPSAPSARELIPKKIAALVWECISKINLPFPTIPSLKPASC